MALRGFQRAPMAADNRRFRRATQMLALGSLWAGCVHAGLCPAHFREATLFGIFFAVAATLQLVWAGLIVSRPSRRLLVVGALGNLGIVAVWVGSRTVGIPFGPTPWQPEPVGLVDVLASVIEVAIAAGALRTMANGLVATRDTSARRLRTTLSEYTRKARNLLPVGSTLPDEVWAQRHRWIVAVLWLHVPGVFVFDLARGGTAIDALVESTVVAAFAVAVAFLRAHRRVSMVLTSLGLLTCSALLVRLSNGSIEMHFHYFVMVGVITLYQDWWPFLMAIGYVVFEHGLLGVVDPSSVYNHKSAVAHPWEWAAIHGFFVLGMSAAGIASWRLNESFLAGVIERQEQLEEAQHVAQLGGWERNVLTGKTVWSAELFRILGLDPVETWPGPDAFFGTVHPDDRPAVEAGLAATWETGTPFTGDVRVDRAGETRWLQVRAKPTAFSKGRPAVVAGTVQDITDRKDAEATLHQTLSLLGATLDATADGILVVDSEGKITSFNRRFVDLWQIPEDVLATADDDTALAFVVGQVAEPDAFLARVHELYALPDAESQDVIEFHDGRIFERFSTPQRVGGEVVGRVWSFRDITERKRLERELSHQAFHDPLTNLANQALFRDRVDHALARASRHDTAAAVLFLDLDNFKTVNDSLGHTAGDELLVAVADRLRGCLREADTAARLGGDEFAVLIEDVEHEIDVASTASRIMAALQNPFIPGGREVFLSASIGIAFGAAGSSSDQLLRNGDLAMYTAKRRGKNRFDTYRAEMHATAVDRLEIEADLRRALGGGQLRVAYQPIVTLERRTIVGVEALVRWEHPEKGILGPAAFIPIAEEIGLIRELGHQVMVEACTQMRRWQVEQPNAAAVTVSVNVSPHQVHHDDLLEHVQHALDVSGLPAHSLVLEFTETAMMRDTEATIAKLKALKGLGVRLAIDDFGTGYSSLSYLQRFPVDILKIDRSFVSGVDPSDHQSSLASAIISLASVLGVQAIAEGIESEAQAESLAAMGCGLGQGFRFCGPVPPETITRLLADNASLGTPRSSTVGQLHPLKALVPGEPMSVAPCPDLGWC